MCRSRCPPLTGDFLEVQRSPPRGSHRFWRGSQRFTLVFFVYWRSFTSLVLFFAKETLQWVNVIIGFTVTWIYYILYYRISWKKIHQWSLFDKACKSGRVMLSINLSGGKGLGFLFSFLFLLVWETLNKGNFNAASIRTLIEIIWIVKQRVVARVTLPNKSYCNEKMIHPGLILTDCGTWTSIHTYDYTYMYWMCLIFFYKKKKTNSLPIITSFRKYNYINVASEHQPLPPQLN